MNKQLIQFIKEYKERDITFDDYALIINISDIELILRMIDKKATHNFSFNNNDELNKFISESFIISENKEKIINSEIICPFTKNELFYIKIDPTILYSKNSNIFWKNIKNSKIYRCNLEFILENNILLNHELI